MIALRLPSVSFGAVSAIITSIGVIVGFGAAGIPKSTIIGSLLIVGLADNLTDSLSIHIYQESEDLEKQAAFRATVGNFVTRLMISMTFIAPVLAFSEMNGILVALGWGIAMLTGLTWLVAKRRGAALSTEIAKHLVVAAVVIAISRAIGLGINAYIS
jgi:hypothetical protein